MTEQAKISLTTGLQNFFMLLFMLPGIAGLFPVGTLDKIQHGLPGVVSAVLTIIGAGLYVWSILPFNKAKKVALAGELPDVSRVVTSDSLARAVPAELRNDGTVVTHREAIGSTPPAPRVV